MSDKPGDPAPKGAIAIDVSRESALWDHDPSAEARIGAAVAMAVEVAALRHLPGAELSVVLTDDAGIRALNAAWRGKDKATNVLSFPAAAPKGVARAPLLGDIVLAYETIADEATTQAITLDAHVVHLVVHGLLHLFGHDHETEDEARTMEGLETAILARLAIDDPYAESPQL